MGWQRKTPRDNETHTPTPSPSTLPRFLAVILVTGCALWGWFDIQARLDPDTGQVVREDDYQVYRQAALALRDDQPLYRTSNARNWPYLYPPLLAVLVSPFTTLSPRAELYAWFLTNLAIALLCFAAMASLARSVAKPRLRAPLLLPGILILFPLIETLHRGQANLIMLLFIVVGLWLLSRSHPGLAAFSWAGASAIKVTPLLIGVWIAWKLIRALCNDRPNVIPPLAAAAGFAVGVIFWWWCVPACVVGPDRARQCLRDYRHAMVAELRALPADDSTDGERTAGMIFKKSNQSWYHFFARVIGQKNYPPSPEVRFALIVWLSTLLLGLLALSSAPWLRSASPRIMTEFAALVIFAVTAGKLAWNHSYLLAWPILIIAAATLRAPKSNPPTLRATRLVLALVFAILWILQLSAPGLLGHWFPLLLATTALTFITLFSSARHPPVPAISTTDPTL